jgi:hypothetical protein
VPTWDQRFEAEREHLDFVSQLREDDSPDLFVHAIFVKEMRILLLNSPTPSGQVVQGIRTAAKVIYRDELVLETMKGSRLPRTRKTGDQCAYACHNDLPFAEFHAVD